MQSLGMIRQRITDPRSLGSRCIKGNENPFLRWIYRVPLMHRDLGSGILFRITPKEDTLIRFDLLSGAHESERTTGKNLNNNDHNQVF